MAKKSVSRDAGAQPTKRGASGAKGFARTREWEFRNFSTEGREEDDKIFPFAAFAFFCEGKFPVARSCGLLACPKIAWTPPASLVEMADVIPRCAMSDDEKAIRAMVDKWLAASQEGDLETVLGLMTDDVVFLVPGREPFVPAARA